MVPEIAKYLTVYFLSMLKFVAGPTLGIAAGFTIFETVSLTVLGMMTSVFIFVFLGEPIRKKIISRFTRKRKRFTKRNRRFVVIWRKYGIFGVSFLTPLIFTPIGGTLLASIMGESKKKIIIWMFFSAFFWAMAFSHFINLFL